MVQDKSGMVRDDTHLMASRARRGTFARGEDMAFLMAKNQDQRIEEAASGNRYRRQCIRLVYK